jgi:hypothetical protein
MSPLKELILSFRGREDFPIRVDEVKEWLIRGGYQDRIEFYPVDVDPGILKGQISQYICRSRPYAEPERVTEVLYSKHMNDCWRRFVCCKELVHILDDKAASTSTSEQIDALTLNLTSPTSMESSDMPKDYWAERAASLKTLCILAQMDAVDKLKQQYLAGAKTPYDVAVFFRIPEVYVDFLFSQKFKAIEAVFSGAASPIVRSASG